MPSAYVAALSVSIGWPARHDSVIAAAASAWTPTTRQSGAACRSHDPTPLISAPLPTGTERRPASAGARRSTASVTSSARVAAPVEIRGVVAVDQQRAPPCSAAYASDAAARVVEVVAVSR